MKYTLTGSICPCTQSTTLLQSHKRENQTQERPKLYELQHTQAFITFFIWAKIIFWGEVCKSVLIRSLRLPQSLAQFLGSHQPSQAQRPTGLPAT